MAIYDHNLKAQIGEPEEPGNTVVTHFDFAEAFNSVPGLV